MPISLHWIEPGRILEYRVEGTVTLEDIRHMLASEAQYLPGPNAPHVLVDASAVRRLPANLMLLRDSALLTTRCGHVALVSQSLVLRTFAEIFAPLSAQPTNYSIHDSRESALRKLYDLHLDADNAT